MSDKLPEDDETEYGLMLCSTSGWKECKVIQSYQVTGAKIVILTEECCDHHHVGHKILVPGNMFKTMVVCEKGVSSKFPPKDTGESNE